MFDDNAVFFTSVIFKNMMIYRYARRRAHASNKLDKQALTKRRTIGNLILI